MQELIQKEMMDDRAKRKAEKGEYDMDQYMQG